MPLNDVYTLTVTIKRYICYIRLNAILAMRAMMIKIDCFYAINTNELN